MFLLFPHKRFYRITEIRPQLLTDIGVKAIILDIDNTMATHDHPIPAIGVFEWLSDVQSAGIRCVILSNNKKERVAPFAELLALPYIARGRKPLPRAFIKAAQMVNSAPFETAVVGDQIFTDILGGRVAKMHCLYVEPIEREKGVFFRFKRLMEGFLFKIGRAHV